MASVAGQQGRLAAGRLVEALLIARIDVRWRRPPDRRPVVARRRHIGMSRRGIGPAAEGAGAVWIADGRRLVARCLALDVVAESVVAEAGPYRVDEDPDRPGGSG